MPSLTDNSVLDRRSFLLGTAAVAAVAPFLGAAAQDDAPQTWQEALNEIVGDAQPIANGKLLTFELPETAENGNMVPFTVAVDSPMTEKDHVRAIHVIATANPQPDVASFHFTPLSGRAAAASRMRLAGTQDVIGLAEFSDGRFVMTRRPVKVVIGGFSG